LPQKRVDTSTPIRVPSARWLSSRLFEFHVLSLHGGDIRSSKKMSPHRSGFYRFVVRNNQSAQAVVASPQYRENAIKYYDIKRDIEVIPLPFHPPVAEKIRRKDLGLSEANFYLITIGRLIKRKNIETMRKGLALVRKKTVRLLIMGDGPELEYLETVVKEQGFRDEWFFWATWMTPASTVIFHVRLLHHDIPA
jgi:glycosyltransferase involved in cell wall biosynthesis